MCKQKPVDFVWIITVKFFYFISFFFSFVAIHFFAASQRNLLAPATMEIMFHQFGNIRIIDE